MLYYAEKYRVGIIQIELTKEQQQNLQDNKIEAKDSLNAISIHFPALPDFVALSEQKEILEKLDIELTKVAQFSKL